MKQVEKLKLFKETFKRNESLEWYRGFDKRHHNGEDSELTKSYRAEYVTCLQLLKVLNIYPEYINYAIMRREQQ